MSSLIGKIFGPTEVVPPPPAVPTTQPRDASRNVACRQRRRASASSQPSSELRRHPARHSQWRGKIDGSKCGRPTAFDCGLKRR